MMRTMLRQMTDRLATGDVGRRQVLRALGALGLVAPMARPRAARAEGGRIDYITWSGYEEPAFRQAFIAKHGEVVDYTFQGDEAEALEKVRAGFPADLMHPCTFITGKYVDAGIVRPIDVTRLSHWNDVFPELASANGVNVDGKVVMMPFDWLTSSVIYRTDLVDPAYAEAESWKLLFDERYKGKIGMYGGDSGVVVAAKTLGIDNVWAMTDDQLAACKEVLTKQSELLRFYFVDPPTMEQAIKSGEIVAAYGWSYSYLSLKRDGVPVGYMQRPKEGAIAWVCGPCWTNVGDAEEDLVYDLLDAMLAPESGRFLIDEWGLGHANRKSFEIASAAVIDEAFASDPLAILRSAAPASPMNGELHGKYVSLIEDVIAESGL